MDIRRNHRVLAQEAELIAIQTVNRARRLTRLHGLSGATLPYGNMNTADISAVQAVVSQHVQMLARGVKLKNTRALSTTQLYGLGSNDLQYAVQVESRCNNAGHAVNGCQFVNFAAQLLIGLFIEAAILAIDRDNSRHNLQEVDLLTRKFTRLGGVYAHHANQAINVAGTDNWRLNQTT